MVSCVAENVLHDSLCSEHLFAAASPDYREREREKYSRKRRKPTAKYGTKRCQSSFVVTAHQLKWINEFRYLQNADERQSLTRYIAAVRFGFSGDSMRRDLVRRQRWQRHNSQTVLAESSDRDTAQLSFDWSNAAAVCGCLTLQNTVFPFHCSYLPISSVSFRFAHWRLFEPLARDEMAEVEEGERNRREEKK